MRHDFFDVVVVVSLFNVEIACFTGANETRVTFNEVVDVFKERQFAYPDNIADRLVLPPPYTDSSQSMESNYSDSSVMGVPCIQQPIFFLKNGKLKFYFKVSCFYIYFHVFSVPT